MRIPTGRSVWLLVPMLAALGLIGCGGGSDSPEPVPAASAEWDAFVERYLEEFFVAHPSFAVSQGRHEFDGQLPDWSAAGIAAEIDRLHTERDRAAGFDDNALDDRQRFERDYLLAGIDRILFWLEDAEWPFRCPQFYFDWLLDNLDPSVYISRHYAPVEERMAAYIGYADSIVTAAEQIRENLRTPLPRTYIDLGVAAFGGYADYFAADVPQAFAEVEDAELLRRFADVNAGAIEAMRRLRDWLESQRATATEEFAIGPELFSKMLWATSRVDVPLERLEAIGRRDLKRNQDALAAACARLVQGGDLAECVGRIATNKPEGGAVAGARAQLGGLRAFLEEHALVSIPGTEEALVEESPPYARSNSAYIDIPGPYDAGLPSVYYISPPDPSWTPDEQAAYVPGRADLLFTSVHEVWPGHFLQYVHAKRAASNYGQVFSSYSFGEGWAHYSEEMMWEAGLGDGDPETHVGQLLNALLRNVRFLSAIGLHTGGMTVEASERMFRGEGHQDAGNSRQQAARGTYDPAYLNYTMGKLIIRKLRADWTAEQGGRDAWGRFHDELLSFGSPPLPLVRTAMLGDGAGPAL